MEDTIKCYLVLDFKDAALIVTYKSKPKPYAKSSSFISGPAKYEAPDYDAPIGVSQLTNAIHIMCGLPPVPCKRKSESIFTHCEELVKMAQNSYIHYDNNSPLRFVTVKENEEVKYSQEIGDMFYSHKPFYNSKKKEFKTTIDGHTYNGLFNWTIFKERVQGVSKELWNELLTLFNETLSSDNVINDYAFANFVEEFHKHLDDPQVKKFREKRYDNYQKLVSNGLCKYQPGGVHLRLVFNEVARKEDGTIKDPGNDHGPSTPYPIFISGTPGYLKQRYKGRIIIPIYDDKVKEMMKEVGIIPNILEGGLVSIVGFKKSINQDYLEKNYAKITEQKMTERFNTQIVRG